MKKLSIIISAIFVFAGNATQAQMSCCKKETMACCEKPSKDCSDTKAKLIQLDDENEKPIFIVKFQNREAEFQLNEVNDIDPYWIQKVDVVKDGKASEKYGKNGVVFISLKEDSIENLPELIKSKFKG